MTAYLVLVVGEHGTTLIKIGTSRKLTPYQSFKQYEKYSDLFIPIALLFSTTPTETMCRHKAKPITKRIA